MNDNQLKVENGNLVISIPLKSKRYDVYNGEKYGEMDNIIGVIAGSEIGFSYMIDMSYKGKCDQVGETFYKFTGEKSEFVKFCEDNNISVMEYSTCKECGKVIYGAGLFTCGGMVCYDCQKEIYKLKN